MEPIIRGQNLVKEFHTIKRQSGFLGGLRTVLTPDYLVTRAVDGISFAINEGDLIGYIGPNGAGKSTTLKILTGILVPTSGEVIVNGRVPWKERERHALDIGTVFGQHSQLWWDLPLRESFKLVAKMYRMSTELYRRNLERFVELLDMSDFLNTPVRQLSLGQRMRGDIAAAMLHEPRILFLDEPTIGLDVVAKERIRLFVEEVNRDRMTTIILTTHDLTDVERLCRRIILIDHGKLLYDGPVEQLKARYAPYRVLVVTLVNDGLMREIANGELVRRQGPKVWIRFDPAQVAVPDLIGSLLGRYQIQDLAIEEPELEKVIRQIYQDGEVVT